MTIVFCDSFKRYGFFKRLESALEFGDLLFVTSDPLVYFRRSLSRRKSIFLGGRCLPELSGYALDELEAAASASIEVLNDEVLYDHALSEISSSLNRLDALFAAENITQAIVWNGQQLMGRICTLFCKKHGIRVSYLEISNLPQKLFVDSAGVNALYSVCKFPSTLDDLEVVSATKHEAWKFYYVEQKKKPLPQSSVSYAKVPLLFVNKILKIFFRGVGDSNILFKRLQRVDQSNRFLRLIDGLYPGSEFIFFPLQVTNDTQVKLHSDLDLQEAIMRALKVAKQRGKRLVIKMHPAESGIEILDYLEEIKKDSVVFVSNANTVDLIQRSSCVVTINSTVGLEALIFKKDLITLGSALYQDFNQERLLKYIHGYLIDGVDVFGNTKIPKDQALQLIEKK